MNDYLLDTHALIWYARNNPQLSNQAYSIITNAQNKILVSDISYWEMALVSIKILLYNMFFNHLVCNTFLVVEILGNINFSGKHG